MLVLDVSGSMNNSDSVTDMVDSTNESIQNLLDLNIHNRVGVVLYSGNSRLRLFQYKYSYCFAGT